MDFGKLSQNEKLLLYGAVAAVVGGLVASISGAFWIAILAGIAMIVVILLPQFSPQTQLPGSSGSIRVAIGALAGLGALLALLTVIADIGYWFQYAAVRTIFFLIAVAGAALMAWIAWQEFQAEGGKFDLGASSAPSPSGVTGAAQSAADTASSAVSSAASTASSAADSAAGAVSDAASSAADTASDAASAVADAVDEHTPQG